MKIIIKATKHEIEVMKDDLYAATGQTFETNEQIASGISCILDEGIEIPGYDIELEVIKD